MPFWRTRIKEGLPAAYSKEIFNRAFSTPTTFIVLWGLESYRPIHSLGSWSMCSVRQDSRRCEKRYSWQLG